VVVGVEERCERGGCGGGCDLDAGGSVLDPIGEARGVKGGGTGLVWVEVGLFARHVLGQGEDGHAPGDGRLDHFFQRVGGVPAELAGMAVVGEWHV